MDGINITFHEGHGWKEYDYSRLYIMNHYNPTQKDRSTLHFPYKYM